MAWKKFYKQCKQMGWNSLKVGGFLLLLSCWWLPQIALAAPLTDAPELFAVNCAGCHLQGGNIVRRGKTLKLNALERNGYNTPAAITEIIAQGKGNMSAYQERLSGDEINILATYVWEQAQQGWPKNES
jgi:cytochrome c6